MVQEMTQHAQPPRRAERPNGGTVGYPSQIGKLFAPPSAKPREPRPSDLARIRQRVSGKTLLAVGALIAELIGTR